MNVAVKWGIILGVVVAVLGFIFGGAGLHTNPIMAIVFVGLAVVINVVVVILALRHTASTNSWGLQVRSGLVIGVLGAVLIFLGSWIMTSVVFPDYYEQMRDGYMDFFEAANLPEDQIEAQMETLEAATPVRSALQGALGTLATSIVVAAIAGTFIKKK
jgi:hypothetical protein